MKTIVQFLFFSLITATGFSQLERNKSIGSSNQDVGGATVDPNDTVTPNEQFREIAGIDYGAGGAGITRYEKQIKESTSPVFFEENKGQVKDQYWQPRPDVLYYGQSEGMSFYIREDGISYQLKRIESWKEEGEDWAGDEHGDAREAQRQVPDQISTYRVDINWIGAQTPQAAVCGMQPHYNNYYNVPDGVEPALDVKQYEKLTLKSLWPGIDMEYYSRNGHLESDWIVQHAEDYKQIAFEVKGADLRIENGTLIMKTPLGEIAEGALKTFQSSSGSASGLREIASYWKLNGNTVSLELENYNPAEPLRIDPPVRLWGTYDGEANTDVGYSCSVDNAGNVFLAGRTESTGAIATTGAHQITMGGVMDAFLVKFNSDGVKQWGTYYGGSVSDEGFSCAVDNVGNVFLAGKTNSINAIATPGAHQTTNGGGSDAFLVKFDGDGVRQWGTYYGGMASDEGWSCSVDGNGFVYLAGETGSSASIATAGAHQELYGGGGWDAFLVKFDGDGVVQWGTYYGGSQNDWGLSSAVDGGGDVYLAGRTVSTDNIATTGAHQATSGGNVDAFLVKFNSNGIRQWGTFYGGTSADWGRSCAVDEGGDVYLAGNTSSTSAIATAGAHQTTKGVDMDAYLVKFNSNGVRQWASYYGGNGVEAGHSCVVDENGFVYLAGETTSTDAIATAGAHQTINGEEKDAFLVKFDALGVRQWGTYYGGDNSDIGFSCALDGSLNVYLAGATESTNAIATDGAHQTTHGGEWDAFLVKFSDECTVDGPFTESVCVNTDMTNITHTTTGATGIGSSGGLPSGVTASFEGNTITISGTPTAIGTFNYSIPLTGSSCGNLDAAGTITVDECVGMEEHQKPDFVIYPNPNDGQFILQTENDGVFQLLDMSGKLITTFRVTTGTFAINEQLPSGMYFMRELESQTTLKLIVK